MQSINSIHVLISSLALLLSKDSISVDILSFGEINDNHEQLEDFISKVNIDNNSHLYEVTPNQSFRQFIMNETVEEDFGDFDDLDLRRAIEESRRTYQMVFIIMNDSLNRRMLINNKQLLKMIMKWMN